jgi:hypothetical protein
MTHRPDDWEIEFWARGVRGRWWREACARAAGAARAGLGALRERRLRRVATASGAPVAAASPQGDALARLDHAAHLPEPGRAAAGAG